MHHYACCQLWAVIVFHVALQHLGIGGEPLLLTPLLDKNDIPAALRLSEVKDPNSIIPRSYAGFITADRQLGNHLFFWFFPAISQSNAPLVVWLNGGPGVSSMLGLTWENGPIRVKSLGDEHVTYERWEKSWAETFSMLYIDNPVGVGYSYSDNGTMGFRTTQDGYAGDLYSFIEQFYVMFPEYLKRELYIGGQSYAGKYVLAFAHRIHKEILAKRSSIPLTGIYLLGPYFDPEIQSEAFGTYHYAMGAISYSELTDWKKGVTKLFEDYRENALPPDYSAVFFKLFPLKFDSNNYVTMEKPAYANVEVLMQMPQIRDMIHVGDLKFYTINSEVQSTFVPDFLVSTKVKLADLMDSYKVLIVSGDYDGLITSVMVDNALMTTPWSGQAEFNVSRRSVWRTGKKQIHGYYSSVGQFCRVVIHGAGHQIPYDQPDSSRDMMVHFAQRGCILGEISQAVSFSRITAISIFAMFSAFISIQFVFSTF